jgi:hypothetical protein
VAGLDPAPAGAAAANVDLIADGQRAGLGQLLDVLGRDPLQDQLAAAAGTGLWQPDRDDLVDPLGWLPVRVPAVGRAGLAPGALGVGPRVAPGEWGGLALGGAAQVLDLGPQPLVGRPQPLTFGR